MKWSTTALAVVLFQAGTASAWIPLSPSTSSLVLTTNNKHHHHCRPWSLPPCYSTTSTNNNNNRPELPDYGKTSVEVDKIHLEAKEQWRRRDLFGTSLIDQTLEEMDRDQRLLQDENNNNEKKVLTKEERIQRRRALDSLGISGTFSQYILDNAGVPAVTRKEPKIFQLNIGLYCNQACGHCHVESSPLRKNEMMTMETAAQCLKLLQSTDSITTLDLTGGAPELNTSFRYLVSMARSLRPEIEIIDRCNLTVLQEPGQEDLVDFLKEHKVRIIASLPCYSEENVDKQRGNGVFERSIAALLALKDAGYGVPGSDLKIDLVYNPLGAFLPPEQSKLEVQYKKVLQENFGILFNQLFTITNMPIKRFADFLHRRGELKDYMDLLVRNFNADTLNSLMCLDTVSVGYDGKLYDCDFNQQLGMSVVGGPTVFDVENLTELQQYNVRTDTHCFGCTSGMGSSCQGETAS